MNANGHLSLTDRFRKVDQAYTKLVYWISLISPAFLIVIMIVAVIDVLCTKLFHYSIPNAYAVVQYFSVPNIYLSVASVQMTRGHTRMGMFQENMPKIPKMIAKVFSNALGAAVSALMCWEAFRLLITYIQQGKTSTTNNLGGIVLWPFVLCFAAGYVFLTIAFLFCTARAVLYRNDEADTRSAAQMEADEALEEAEAAESIEKSAGTGEQAGKERTP